DYAEIITDPNAGFLEKGAAYVGGFFSALWTRCTSDNTVAALSLGRGANGWISRPGFEWSHWIPSRYSSLRKGGGVPFFGNRRLPTWATENVFNGKYVPALQHAVDDPSRYRFLPKFLKAILQENARFVQQWNRVPDWLKFWPVSAYSGSRNNPCECR
ncbi:MAG: hypothetical protein ACM3JH_12970, partial [Acidithiobacillales bacterium]